MFDKTIAGFYARPPFGNDNQPFWQVIVLILFALVMIVLGK